MAPRSEASVGASSGGPLLVVGLLALVVFLGLTTAVARRGLDHADGLARGLVGQTRQAWLHPVMEAASYVGGVPGQTALVLVASGWLWRRQRPWAVALPVVMAGAAVVQLAAKWAVGRSRPNLDAWGYPSAHTLSLVVLLGYLVYVMVVVARPRVWTGLGAGMAAAALGTVAFSRMYLDAHWLSDIAGGLTSGLAYLLLALALVRRAPSPSREPMAVGRAGAGSSGVRGHGLPAVAGAEPP